MGVGGSKAAVSTTLKHCTLWKADRSPACRSVMMALDAMNLNINEVDLNMDKGEHRSQEIIAMNPLQTLPILQDRELIIRDSHAITSYMAARYCNSDRLLPQDPGGRALVDQLMYYNSSVLYPRFRAVTDPIFYENVRFIMPQHIQEVNCAYTDLEIMLYGHTYLDGSMLTLGDIVVAATISSLDVLVPIDKLKYPKLSSWLYRMSKEPFYLTANRKGLKEFCRRLGELTDTKTI